MDLQHRINRLEGRYILKEMKTDLYGKCKIRFEKVIEAIGKQK